MVSKKSPVQYRQKAIFFIETTISLLLQKLMRMVYLSWLLSFCPPFFSYYLLSPRFAKDVPLPPYLSKETVPGFFYTLYPAFSLVTENPGGNAQVKPKLLKKRQQCNAFNVSCFSVYTFNVYLALVASTHLGRLPEVQPEGVV